MKLDDLVKVASDFPLPMQKKIQITDELLSLEQLPQLLRLFSPDIIEWKYNSVIIGPDGTQIETTGGNNYKKYFYLSPIREAQIGWNISVNTDELVKMIYEILPCKEGEAYFNPSFWTREDIVDNKKIVMESGEINEKLRVKDHKIEMYENSVKLEIGYINPIYAYLNPFIFSQSKHINGRSEIYSVFLKETYNIIGENKIEISNSMGTIKAESNGKIVLLKTTTWKEAKPYHIFWNMKNEIKNLDCKPQYPISLYKLYPSGILPFFVKYDKGILTMGLVNFNDEPVMANLTLAARIEEAFILSPQGIESEKLVPEFDRIRIPIKRYGINYVKIKIRKLLESFLKRKIISL